MAYKHDTYDTYNTYKRIYQNDKEIKSSYEVLKVSPKRVLQFSVCT